MIEDIKAWVRSLFYTKREVDQRVGAGSAALATHAALTAAHGATGTVVGTTNAQTLTNKTLTSPAISDPVITGSTGAWTGLSYGSGWTSYGSGYQAGQYKKVGDLVFLRGLVGRTSGVGVTIATLPSGYRPPAQCLYIMNTNTGAGRLDIQTDGQIVATSGGTDWVQLEGFIFSTVS